MAEQWGSGAQQQSERQKTILRDLHGKVVALYPLQHIKEWWMPGNQQSHQPARMADAGECDLILIDPQTGTYEIRRNVVFFASRMVRLIRTNVGAALLGTVTGDPYQPTSLTWEMKGTDTQYTGPAGVVLERIKTEAPGELDEAGNFRRSTPGDYSDRAKPYTQQRQQNYEPGPGQQGYHNWGDPNQYGPPPQPRYDQRQEAYQDQRAQQWGQQHGSPQWGPQQGNQQQGYGAPQGQPQGGPQWGNHPPTQQPPAQGGPQWGPPQQQPPAPPAQQGPQQWGQQGDQQWGQPQQVAPAQQPWGQQATMDQMFGGQGQPTREQGPQF